MKKLLLLLLAVSAWAQQPSAVSVTMLDGDKLAKLGSQIHWASQPGASFDVYFYEDADVYGPCPATIASTRKWIQLNAAPIPNNPAGNRYDNFPTPQPQFNFGLPFEGAGGVWCYGVSNVVNGVDGPITAAPERMLLGQYLYMRVCLESPPYVPCDTHHGAASIPVQAIWAINRNGVPMPVRGGNKGTGFGFEYASVFRALSTDTVNGSLTLTDGTKLALDEMIGPQSNPAEVRNYVQFFLVVVDKTTKTIATTDHQERFRVASPID